jgi:pyruvate/2-oxoglutarate/acetoin dehydrogenase E1 component
MNLTYGQAVNKAIYDELKNEDKSFMMGQDIEENVYGYTNGLKEEFGIKRIFNTPLSEAATTGTAIGSSMCGLRPILDLTVSSFLYVAMDQLVSMASKTHYMYDGQYSLPMTIMCSSMYGVNNSCQHSDRPHSLFMGIPGLKIAVPSSPQDAYSLHRSAFRDENPVLVFTDRSLFYDEEQVDLNLDIPLGHAHILKKGSMVTIVSISGAIKKIKECLGELDKLGIDVELIDVRTLVPLDTKTIYESVEKTGRLLIVDTANRTCSAASHISSLVSENIFSYLKAPISIVSYDDVPVPFARNLENMIMVTPEKIVEKVKYLSEY